MRRLLAIALSSTLMVQAAPLMAAPRKGHARDGGVPAAATGGITGTTNSAAGETLQNCTIQVRNLQTGKLALTGTSDAAGSFSFTGLPPATYVVEVRDAGSIVGSYATRPVVAGGTVDITVSAAIDKTAPRATTASSATSVVTAAAAAGIVARAGDDRPNASPSR